MTINMQWISRQSYFLDYALSSLLRRKWKNFSLIFVYGLIIFMIASVLFFSGAIRNEAEYILEDAPAMIVQRVLAGRHDLIPEQYISKIKEIRGVYRVTSRLWGYYYHPASQANYTVMVGDQSPQDDDEVTIGNGVLRTWGTISDNQLYFKAYDGETIVLSIADTLDAATELVSSDLILVSIPTFRRLFGMPEEFSTDVEVHIRNPSECPVIADKILRMLPDTRPILKEEILRTYASLFDLRSGYIIVLLSGAILAFFIFAWDKATGLSAEEKAEIGILKALGWDTSDILLLKFWEGIAICFTAFVPAVIGAYLHVFLASAPLFEHALKGWSILYPEFQLNPHINAYQLGVVFALTVLPYTLITIIPAWRVSTTDPDKVMRQF